MAERTFRAAAEELDNAIGFVEGELEALDFPMKGMMAISVAVEELFVNVAHYAYAPGTGDVIVTVDPLKTGGAVSGVRITLKDHGVPFNPLDKPDPDITLSAEERRIGGLGIYMVKKSMDSVSYEYTDSCNVLSITKNI